MKEKIEKIIETELLLYGEKFGAICHHAGKDGERKLPEDPFLEIYKERIADQLMNLIFERIADAGETQEIKQQ